MSILFICPVCERRFELRKRVTIRKRYCPECGQKITREAIDAQRVQLPEKIVFPIVAIGFFILPAGLIGVWFILDCLRGEGWLPLWPAMVSGLCAILVFTVIFWRTVIYVINAFKNDPFEKYLPWIGFAALYLELFAGGVGFWYLGTCIISGNWYGLFWATIVLTIIFAIGILAAIVGIVTDKWGVVFRILGRLLLGWIKR